MRDLDDTDLNILRLLLEDASRTYSDIADVVGVSPPTVSDRIDRLRSMGIIRRFTIDIDMDKLSDGVAVLAEVDLCPTIDDDVLDRFADLPAVDHAYLTADSRVVLKANVARGEVRELLAGAVDLDRVENYEVSLLSADRWEPQVTDANADVPEGTEQQIVR
ncbi:Lrp/AsnC family transcriptional regulator [Haloarchaeobius sp. HME9146]|uniref:Lrp/AsnC family transcriptional regulator n=1 Tax=Haloarchaeobius sp. HME9146 TaxID=2978732 RepID=UPI0021BFAF61|nr:Lrp/AsnC family transcriptional regulator [Haloarchaeobius sp. HME9146]MCT9096564.1 Lrp/AsnC family transcriptional regulator [Haloarchaeobius sp. HME9146]